MQSLAPAPTSAMHSSSQDVVSEQLLREQLLSQVNTSNNARDQNEMQTSSPASPNDPLDHTMGGSGYGKRELSTSKRAAQNRAAQRAFRQRKEGYIKKLEEQVRDYTILNENYKAIQAENYQLRDYIINLQSRLIESQGEFPQPPPNIDGLHPGNPGQQQHAAQHAQQHQGPSQQQHHHAAGPGESSNIAAGLDQMRGAPPAHHLGRAGDPRGHTPEGQSYHPHIHGHGQAPESHSPGMKRMKVDEREMTAAQQALQGRVER
ncbi:hypothetical protein GJ744_008229 [Endocarpon pusillum]|uniref:Putative transcription factor kapC n=1 Tax=Endocarpon pusillum TaxID=364733 RepID=A0A8H7E3H1_9EURO|nr:hypothetical protein GJ744_008229 [Endocarpon pusillum]